MFYRRSIPLTLLALLCSPLSSIAGSISYESLEGNRCNVNMDAPTTLDFEGGYDEDMGANVRFGLTVPLGNTTGTARDNCVQFAEQDQRRQHFVWLLEMYERGVITREALEQEANELGMQLAPESAPQSSGRTIRVGG